MSEVYDSGLDLIAQGPETLLDTELWVLLVTNAYVFDRTGHATVADLVAQELGVGGYARQGLADKTLSAGAAVRTLRAADSDWGDLVAGETIGGAVVYRRGVDDASSTLVAFHVPPAGIPTNGGGVVTEWPNGVVRFNAVPA